MILKESIAGKGARLAPEQRRRCEALREVPASVSKSRTDFTIDPAPLEKARERIARAIERLRRGE